MPASHQDAKHRQLRDHLQRVLSALDYELLPEEEKVVDAFMATDRHLSVQDLARALVRDHPEVDVSHVRRTLRLLVDLGIARRFSLDEGTFYEHLHMEEHHDHLLCLRCGRIEGFVSRRIEDEQMAACREAGFEPLFHSLIIRGICRDCTRTIPATRSLASCLAGESVEITDIVGGKTFKQRLLDLGLTRGTRLHILRNDGPLALEVRGSRIALGAGQARKIMTKRFDEPPR